jgi:hypothetical protein
MICSLDLLLGDVTVLKGGDVTVLKGRDVTVLKARDVTLYVGLLDPEGEGSTMFRNVKNCHTNGTVSHTKRLKSSATPVRAPELSCW